MLSYDESALRLAPDDPDKPYWIPVRCHRGDAGIDLHVSERTVIPVGRFEDVPTNLRVQLPAQSWGLLIGRSSTFRKKGLMVIPGIIDNGYRGPIFSAVYNLGPKSVILEPGERISQLILLPLMHPSMIKEVAELDKSSRGEKGFGSTGK